MNKIITDKRNQLNALSTKNKVIKVNAFGSVLNLNFNNQSDIDLI